jgi:acetyl esterase/lipase
MRAFHLLRASCLVFVLAARAASSAQSPPDFPDEAYYVAGSCTPQVCGSQSTQCLDVYIPTAPLPGAPTVLFVHGGGWGGGNKRGSNEAEFCSRLKDLGHAVVSINYTLACAGNPSFPQAVQDVRAALAWIRGPGSSSPYFLSSCVVAVGTSAGGHLAAMLGVLGDNTDPFFVPFGAHNLKFAPQAVIPISGPFDFYLYGVAGGGTTPAGCCGPVTFPPGYKPPDSILNKATQEFLPCTWAACGGLPCTPATPKWNDPCLNPNVLTGYPYLDASPIHWVTPADPPFYFLQSVCDPRVPAVESEWMIDALESEGVRTFRQDFNTCGHAFTVFPSPLGVNAANTIAAILQTELANLCP